MLSQQDYTIPYVFWTLGDLTGLHPQQQGLKFSGQRDYFILRVLRSAFI